MANRWFGRSRRSPQRQAAATEARDGAVAAFLDVDTRQRFVTDAVEAVRSLDPRSRLLSAWKQVEQKCFEATAEYVATSTQFDLEDSAGQPLPVDVPAAVAAYQRTHRTLADAAAGVDRFYERHRKDLDGATAALAATPRIAEEAVQAALGARAALTGHPDVAGFRSVRDVSAALDAATRRLDTALGAGASNGVREAANEIHTVTHEVQAVLAATATAGTRARTAISAVRTRIDAVSSHIDRVPAARSALLREFSEPNSADLVGNLELARREFDQGQQRWRDAGAELAAGSPEQALDLVAAAREHLTKAADACDQVTDRLNALKAVQADRAGAEQQTRFRIRDAQRLVVDRGLIAEWGSVLDAQSRRVDVARQKLVGAHPNYWAYLSELALVRDFVKGVVERIRGHASSISG